MSKLQQGALTMKAAGCIALATGVIGLSHVDTYLESILIGKSHPPGMDLLSALGLIFVGVSVFANLYSKKLFLVRTAILSILLGMMSAFTYQSQVAQSIEDGAGTHRVLDGIWMHSSSPLGGFSVTLTAFCFY